MIYIQPVYKVKILYKSGNSVTFEFISFKVTHDSAGIKSAKYSMASGLINPIWMNVDEIEAIYQIGTRFRLRFGKKSK